jgi:hypothetical protein
LRKEIESLLKNEGVAWGIVFLGIVALISGVVLGTSAVGALADSLGANAAGRVVVSITKNASGDARNFFTTEEIRKLSEQPGTRNPAAVAESRERAAFGGRSVDSVIRGVSPNYPSYYTIRLAGGSFFTKKDEQESNRVAVIEEELALELFKTANAVGNEIELYDRTFRIVGVAEKDPSLPGFLTERKEPVVYIPVNVLLELDQEAGISSVRAATAEKDLLGRNEDMAAAALRAVGKNPSNYSIKDYGIEEYFMEQIIQLVLFVPGMALILILAVRIKNGIRRTARVLSSACKTDYLANVLRTNKDFLRGELVRVALLSGGVLAVWLGIRFRLFIPPDYIPDDLADLSYYFNLLKENLLQRNSLIGSVPPAEEILLASTKKVLYLVAAASLAAGIPMLLTGLYRLKRKGARLCVLAPVCSAMAFAAVALASLASAASGMPPALNTKGLMILFAFVFINSILFSKERDEVF